jgi:hypothetical protein
MKFHKNAKAKNHDIGLDCCPFITVLPHTTELLKAMDKQQLYMDPSSQRVCQISTNPNIFRIGPPSPKIQFQFGFYVRSGGGHRRMFLLDEHLMQNIILHII